MARRRSGSTTSPAVGAPLTISAMIVAGSSLRGLSDVTTATLRAGGRGRAHRRPLGAVAVAAGAEHHQDAMSGGHLARRVEHTLETVGRVGVVDDDAERLALVDRLEPPRHRSSVAEARGDRVDRDAELGGRGGRGQGVRDVEAPAERHLARARPAR